MYLNLNLIHIIKVCYVFKFKPDADYESILCI